jgi:hypothetical protein
LLADIGTVKKKLVSHTGLSSSSWRHFNSKKCHAAVNYLQPCCVVAEILCTGAA